MWIATCRGTGSFVSGVEGSFWAEVERAGNGDLASGAGSVSSADSLSGAITLTNKPSNARMFGALHV